MIEGEDVNMVESSKSKLDVIINTLNTLANKSSQIEGFFEVFIMMQDLKQINL